MIRFKGPHLESNGEPRKMKEKRTFKFNKEVVLWQHRLSHSSMSAPPSLSVYEQTCYPAAFPLRITLEICWR
jgi:hypothetical protein